MKTTNIGGSILLKSGFSSQTSSGSIRIQSDDAGIAGVSGGEIIETKLSINVYF